MCAVATLTRFQGWWRRDRRVDDKGAPPAWRIAVVEIVDGRAEGRGCRVRTGV
jgi:hypothetical protein